MALNADIVGPHVIELARVHNVLAGGMSHMLCARTVAAFAAHVPLSYGVRPGVEVHRVAPVAERTGRALPGVRGIELWPPIGAVPDKVRQPLLVRDIPLCRKHEIIV